MGKRKTNIDMLSGLPDEVLCHILSFLSTKRSLCTSVLAKRWRFLWAHVPNLQFYQYNFRVDSETQPLNIISRVVMLHEAKVVNTFSFRLSHLNGCAYQLLTLIIHLVKRNVRNLYLEFDCENEDVACTVPRLLLTCKTLVDLKLVNCGVIFSSGELFLPSLKKLNLSCVEYEDEKSLPRLLSGCLMLEELIVKDCFMGEEKNMGCVIVSSPTIKTLTVVFSQSYEWYIEERLRIDVPNLVYLKVDCCDFSSVKSLRKTMTSLIEVDITVYGGPHDWDIDYTVHSRSIEFLSCLSHVKCLKITCGCQFILVDIVGTASLPKFVHLTRLQLDFTVDSFDLVKFLEAADNLEVLIINSSRSLTYKEPKRVPPCMSSRLRTVRMYQFSACEDAFDTVGYVLRNARALEKMEIDPTRHISCDKVKLIDALRRILLFERGSTSCQLAFNTD